MSFSVSSLAKETLDRERERELLVDMSERGTANGLREPTLADTDEGGAAHCGDPAGRKHSLIARLSDGVTTGIETHTE